MSRGEEKAKRRWWRPRFSVRTLVILCAIFPPLIAMAVHASHWRYCGECGTYGLREEMELHPRIHETERLKKMIDQLQTQMQRQEEEYEEEVKKWKREHGDQSLPWVRL